MSFGAKSPMYLIIGFVAGAAMAYVDNYAFEGEVSPIIIVAMLLATTATAGVIRGWRGWAPAAVAWACIPLAHLAKHILGLPDTLNPNTYTSIIYLAAFTLIIAVLGLGGGALIRNFANSGRER